MRVSFFKYSQAVSRALCAEGPRSHSPSHAQVVERGAIVAMGWEQDISAHMIALTILESEGAINMSGGFSYDL